MKKVTHETEEGDMLYAVAKKAMEELDKAQKDQDRLHDEIDGGHGRRLQRVRNLLGELEWAFREVNYCRALHVEGGADLKKACQRTAEVKRRATDAHEKHVSTENVAEEQPKNIQDLKQRDGS